MSKMLHLTPVSPNAHLEISVNVHTSITLYGASNGASFMEIVVLVPEIQLVLNLT